MSDQSNDAAKRAAKRAKLDKLSSDILEAKPYLASDEKSSVLNDPYPSNPLPKDLQRPEPDQQLKLQYDIEKARKNHTEPQSKLQNEPVKPWVHFVAGGLGGMCGAICTSPFDVVKTRLQSSVYRDAYKSKAGSYSFVRSLGMHFKETCSILYNVYSIEGWRALFKGLGPTLVGVIPARSINFFTYGYTKEKLKQTEYFHGEENSLLHLLAGINAGIVTSTATNPIWLIKTRLQLDKATTKQYKNSWDCLKKVVTTEGVTALYAGLSASYLGSAESTIQWVLYEQMRTMIRHRAERMEASGKTRTRVDDVADWFARSGAAGFAKLIASLITYPHEVVRTRLRQAPMEDGKPKYTGLIQCFKLVLKEEGFVSMYGGLTPHLMRTVPNSMIMFGSWEVFTKLLSSW